MVSCDWLLQCQWAWPVSTLDIDVLCRRLCALAQTTKQEMEDGASPRKSEEAEATSSEDDSGLDVKASNTTEEENDKTPGLLFLR